MHKSINACLSSKSRVKMPSAQSPCRQTALHQAKLLLLISVTATGLRYTSKGHGSSEERVLVRLMIYLFSNSYRSSNPFTLLPSPSTKVFNFFLDSLFFFFFPPFTECLLPNKQALITFFQGCNFRTKSTKICSQSLYFHKDILSKGHFLQSTILISYKHASFSWYDIPIFPFLLHRRIWRKYAIILLGQWAFPSRKINLM